MDPDITIASEKSHLMSLPQELLDLIFEFTYQEPGPLVLTFNSVWNTREVSKRRSTGGAHTVRPFPSYKVDEFLVCKAFFAGAAKAYIGGRTIYGEYHVPSAYIHDIVLYEGIGAAFLRHAGLRCCELWGLGRHNLRSIHVLVTKSDFDVDVKFPEVDRLDDADFAAFGKKWHLSCYPGKAMRPVSIRLRSSPRVSYSVAKTLIWEDNLQRLERYINAEAESANQDLDLKNSTSSPSETSSISPDTPLYPGSKVSATSSVPIGSRPTRSLDVSSLMISPVQPISKG